MPGALLEKIGVRAGDTVRLKQATGENQGEVQLSVACDDKLPANCVRVASACKETAALGAMFGDIVVEKT